MPQTQITLVGEHTGWHITYLHTQYTGEYSGCLLKIFQPIWSPMAAALLGASCSPVKLWMVLFSAPMSCGPSTDKGTCWELKPSTWNCLRDVHPHAQTHLFGLSGCFSSQEGYQLQTALWAACWCSCRGNSPCWQTPSPPQEDMLRSQLEEKRSHPAHCRSGGGTQPATNASYCLGAKGWISFY